MLVLSDRVSIQYIGKDMSVAYLKNSKLVCLCAQLGGYSLYLYRPVSWLASLHLLGVKNNLSIIRATFCETLVIGITRN